MRIDVDQISRDVARNHQRHRVVRTSHELRVTGAAWLMIGVVIGILFKTFVGV